MTVEVLGREADRAWAQRYFGRAQLGHQARTQRLVATAAGLASGRGRSLSERCGGDMSLHERMSRYARDPHAEPEAIVQAACAESCQDVMSWPGEVVVISDTTTLAYPHASVFEELGDLGGPAARVSSRRSGGNRGVFVHNTLAVEADSGGVLGLVDQQYGCRDAAQSGSRHQRRERLSDEKESVKWEASFRTSWERLHAVHERLIFVTDRESDVFEYLSSLCEEGARFVVRARQNRRLRDASLKLCEQVRAQPVRGHVSVSIPQRGGRSARTARLALRATTVQARCALHTLEPLPDRTWSVVEAVETEPPEGSPGLHWILLTSEPIQTLEQLARVLHLYSLRWSIEEFHRCWKSGGTQVESLRLQAKDALLRMAIPLAFVAARLMQLRAPLMRLEPPSLEGSESSEPSVPEPSEPVSCETVVTTLQWKVLWLKRQPHTPLPPKPPPLSWVLHELARLGGWMDTKRTGRPGYKALWTGWFRLDEAVEGVLIAQKLASQGGAL